MVGVLVFQVANCCCCFCCDTCRDTDRQYLTHTRSFPQRTQRSSCRGCLFAQSLSMFCASNHFQKSNNEKRDCGRTPHFSISFHFWTAHRLVNNIFDPLKTSIFHTHPLARTFLPCPSQFLLIPCLVSPPTPSCLSLTLILPPFSSSHTPFFC